jgi:hypothetical protein
MTGIPTLLAELGRAAGGGAAHIVDQHVDAAETGAAGAHQLLDLRAVGRVAFMRLDLAAGVAHARQRLGHGVGVLVGRKDPGALLGEDHRHGAAIAPARADAARAGHDCDLALQPSRHAPSRLDLSTPDPSDKLHEERARRP